MAAASPPLLEMRDVGLAFGKEEVLSGINLHLTPRERLIVFGQSGCGKSTLLRLILGILKPNRGSLQFKGLEISRMGRRPLNKMRQKIGMVYQNSALISSLNVRDNLALPLEELTDKPRKEIDEIVMNKLELVGMAAARAKMPAELSGGMCKRVALARGIIMDPEIILYDEPSAGLDPITSTLIDRLIISLSEKIDAASIVVTHDVESAFLIATRMAMIYKGRIIADDKPEAFKKHPDPVVARFISGDTQSPPREELPEGLA